LSGLVGTWFVAKVTKVHIVQESVLLEGEVEAMVLENHLPHLLMPITHQVAIVHVRKVHSVHHCPLNCYKFTCTKFIGLLNVVTCSTMFLVTMHGSVGPQVNLMDIFTTHWLMQDFFIKKFPLLAPRRLISFCNILWHMLALRLQALYIQAHSKTMFFIEALFKLYSSSIHF
jgi:hypothetical protein